MLTTAEFFRATQWAGILTVAFAILAGLAFLFKWGFRFRLVGVTGFMAVLTGGLFALSIVPITRTQVAGAAHYTTVFDSGSSQVVISVSPKITQSELEATLRQAASNLFSPGRFSQAGEKQLTIRARTIIHPETGVSIPLYLGEVKRSLYKRDDEQMTVEVFNDKLAQLPTPVSKQ
ncbi:Ycf51 family protein [Ancylothrix sp. C2]|uniref:Ycf51 family protein n=1 Tax=Ancylothrix sp. D3o TaxID=2953691 RepID=UPI0021BB7C83|nr:Ycf51 family protein [Ancylothrix sp. D3o]MCT7949689.1 Ycf51 family protein [Ancylothrix sp. D3o]